MDDDGAQVVNTTLIAEVGNETAAIVSTVAADADGADDSADTYVRFAPVSTAPLETMTFRLFTI